MFTNPPIEVGEDYYVFIRLYSDIDVSQRRGGRGRRARMNDRVKVCYS
jgi:hypothetical protein